MKPKTIKSAKEQMSYPVTGPIKNDPKQVQELSPEEKKMKKQEEISNLNKNLMKKLYLDLYTKNIDLYQEKNLTFENFLFRFYRLIEDSIDYDNPDYSFLLKKVDIRIKAAFEEENILTPDLDTRQLKMNMNKLAQEDEWPLIYRYQNELYKEQEEKEKEEKKRNLEKYHQDLDNQISLKKNYVNEVELKKDNIYAFKEKEAKEELEKLKLNNQLKIDKIRRKRDDRINKRHIDELEKNNLDLNEANKKLINYKIDYLLNIPEEESKNDTVPNKKRFVSNDYYHKDKTDDEILSDLVDQIMMEKKVEDIEKTLKVYNYKKELEVQISDKIKNSDRPGKMSVEERKMNSDLLMASREYFKNKQREMKKKEFLKK